MPAGLGRGRGRSDVIEGGGSAPVGDQNRAIHLGGGAHLHKAIAGLNVENLCLMGWVRHTSYLDGAALPLNVGGPGSYPDDMDVSRYMRMYTQDDSGGFLAGVDNGAQSQGGVGPLDMNVWYHFALNWRKFGDGDYHIRLHVDGELALFRPDTSALNASIGAIAIGSYATGERFVGDVAGFRLFSGVVMTDERILAEYEAGVDIADPTGLVGSWRMDGDTEDLTESLGGGTITVVTDGPFA